MNIRYEVRKRLETLTKSDVKEAIKLYNENVRDPNRGDSRTTFLIYENRKYPAKHILSIAHKVRYNEFANHFHGGSYTKKF